MVTVGEVRPAAGDTPSASKIYRNAVAEKEFPTIDASTLYELFQNSVRKFGGEKCLGWRPIDSETGKAGDYKWMTYAETNEKVQAIASGLSRLGITKDNRVGVYGVNCPEWMIAMQVGTLRLQPGVIESVTCASRVPKSGSAAAQQYSVCVSFLPCHHVGSIMLLGALETLSWVRAYRMSGWRRQLLYLQLTEVFAVGYHLYTLNTQCLRQSHHAGLQPHDLPVCPSVRHAR